MIKRLTKFNKNWLKSYEWITIVENDDHAAHCNLCNMNFKISHKGDASIKDHANSKGHKRATKGVRSFFRKFPFILFTLYNLCF